MHNQNMDLNKVVNNIKFVIDNLGDQIKTQRMINNDLQWQLAVQKQRNRNTCRHKYDCGCNLQMCNNCKRQSLCTHCRTTDNNCGWCGKVANKTCNDHTCMKYYDTRCDNCACNSIHCKFCSEQNIDTTA